MNPALRRSRKPDAQPTSPRETSCGLRGRSWQRTQPPEDLSRPRASKLLTHKPLPGRCTAALTNAESIGQREARAGTYLCSPKQPSAYPSRLTCASKLTRTRDAEVSRIPCIPLRSKTPGLLGYLSI